MYIGYTFLKSNVECNSDDKRIATVLNASACADACRNTEGCEFFIFGMVGTHKYKRCYWEKTNSTNCVEGWEEDYFDFYQIEQIEGKFSF